MTLVQAISVRCGCDVAKLISLDAALSLIRASAVRVKETEAVSLDAALGRVLAKPVRTRTAMPPFDNAAMDGYAINTAALGGTGPWNLSLVQTLPAGVAEAKPIAADQAARIFTGAPVPRGANAVIMQEAVTATDTCVQITKRPESGANIRRAGEDLTRGAEILPFGKKLRPVDIAACAAAGHGTVDVSRILRVGVLASGDEVHAAGTVLPSGAIWDSNTPMLRALLTRSDVFCTETTRVADDPASVRDQLADMAQDCDVILTTGGISVGDRDFVKPAFSALNGETVFSGVAMKPGKPVTFGKLGQSYWLGLPGNPMAACLAWLLFGRALVANLTGLHNEPEPRKVVLRDDLHLAPGRVEFRPATLDGFDHMGRQLVVAAQGTNSARIAQMAASDGFVRLSSEDGRIQAGTAVDIVPFEQG